MFIIFLALAQIAACGRTVLNGYFKRTITEIQQMKVNRTLRSSMR